MISRSIEVFWSVSTASSRRPHTPKKTKKHLEMENAGTQNSKKNKRQYFICQGIKLIPANVMQAATNADSVFYKHMGDGTVLYALYFLHSNRKQESTIENAVHELDMMLKKMNMCSGTRFVSLTGVGKVKSFGGRDRCLDVHFLQIFDVKLPKLGGGKQYQLCNGVVSFKVRDDASDEFDVVKKRRLMTMDGESNDGETCSDALSRFEQFEAHVLPALLKTSMAYQTERLSELLQMEEDFQAGVRPVQGLVYVAVSNSVKFPKIGATRREDPTARLRELSKSVPSPFEWVFYVRTFTPFRLESEVHAHFDGCRIREKGACTEFFDIDVASIGAYLKSRFAVVERR